MLRSQAHLHLKDGPNTIAFPNFTLELRDNTHNCSKLCLQILYYDKKKFNEMIAAIHLFLRTHLR